MVTLKRRLGFFSERRCTTSSSVLPREHYVREASFGRYEVYRRRTADGTRAPPVDEPRSGARPDALFARLADPDRDIRRAPRGLLARARTREA